MSMSTTISALLLLFGAFDNSSVASLENTPFAGHTNFIAAADETPAFHISGKDVCLNETFTVPMKVTSFDMITSFQFTINWDPAMMTFIDVSEVAAELGNTMLFNMADVDEGTLTASWYDSDVNGVTVEDFTALFQMEFTALADNQTAIDIRFENEPTMMEVSGVVDNDIMLIESDFFDGQVNVNVQELEGYEIFHDINDHNLGGVNISIKNGTPPFTFLWSNNVETQNLTSVGIGDYTVTVTDSKGCIETFGPFTVENTLDVKKISSLQHFGLQPNPASEQLFVNATFEQLEKLDIVIFNILGERVLFEQQETANLNLQLDVSSLNNGTYFLQLRTSNGFHTEKLEIVR